MGRGPDPLPAFMFCVTWAFWVALMSSAATETQEFEVPACEHWWDYLTGCQSGFSQFIALFVVGTIIGAPAIVNTILAIVGLSVRATALWSIVRLFRGV